VRYVASLRFVSLVCDEDDVGSPLPVVPLTKGWCWRMMAARRAEFTPSSVPVADSEEALEALRVGEEMLERLEVKRLTRKLKIIFTSSSRSQYSRSRTRSSAILAVVAGGARKESSGSTSAGSSSMPHNDASLYVCGVCWNVGAK
jgi:hypothetical protein